MTTPLFAVLSETLWETIPLMDDGSGPSEPGAIFEIVAARNRSAAIYAAWKSSPSFEYDMREKPLFHSVQIGTTTRGPGIYTDEDWPYRKMRRRHWEHLTNFEGGSS
jgi:hypothetical protein